MQLGTRMKNYEFASRYFLTRRIPVIIRLDGKAFHSYTRGFDKPWDKLLHNTLCETASFLCSEIQGAKLGYIQSDEINILITDYENINTEPWFVNNIQKIVSVSASLATGYFNKSIVSHTNRLAFFDSRVFNLPKEDVCNYFIWRQQDATRNSIQMLAQYHFSHNKLQNLNTKKLMDKLMIEKNINWNDCETWQKRGSCVYKQAIKYDNYIRNKWTVDKSIPIFTQDNSFISKFI